MLLQAASHCMFIFIAVQDCVVWITSNFIYTFYCCWSFGLFPVFPVWVIWKGYSDHQVCEIPCGFLFFLKNIYLCGARKKKLLLFESSSGILLRDQDLAWESEKPRAAVCLAKRQSAAQLPQDDGNIPSQGCMDLTPSQFYPPLYWWYLWIKQQKAWS